MTTQEADTDILLPFVSIIIPTFRNPDTLRATLLSISTLDYPHESYEIIVVDDGSDDETAAVVEDACRVQSIRFLQQAHGGAGRARNRGAGAAKGDVLLFLDDDMLVPQDLIHAHLRGLRHFDRALICGYRVFSPELQAQLARTPFGRFRLKIEPIQEWAGDGPRPGEHFPQTYRTHRTGGVTANNLAMWRADFLQLGGFDERFPYAGYEDQELAVRARKLGLLCLVNYGLVAYNNDRRISLNQFCERQRRGAATAAILAAKYPEIYASTPLMIENRPIGRGDSLRVVAKKAAKFSLNLRLTRAAISAGIAVAERWFPDGRLLERLYLGMCGLSIYRGIRDGLKSVAEAGSSERTPPAPGCCPPFRTPGVS